MHWFNSIKISFWVFFFITPDLKCVEENLRHFVIVLKIWIVNTANQISIIISLSQDIHRWTNYLKSPLITILEALYTKVLLKNMAKRKRIFSSIWFFLPSQLTDELDRVIWYSQVLNIITALLCTSQSQQWAPAPAAASSYNQWISGPEHCNKSRDNKEHTSNIGVSQLWTKAWNPSPPHFHAHLQPFIPHTDFPIEVLQGFNKEQSGSWFEKLF